MTLLGAALSFFRPQDPPGAAAGAPPPPRDPPEVPTGDVLTVSLLAYLEACRRGERSPDRSLQRRTEAAPQAAPTHDPDVFEAPRSRKRPAEAPADACLLEADPTVSSVGNGEPEVRLEAPTWMGTALKWWRRR